MLVRTTRRRPPARRGAILIVVLAMLALFAIVGISFVFYADAQATASRSNKIAINIDNPPDPLAAVQQFVPVLLYDVGDTGNDLMNPMRGHSLARSKYGYQAEFPRFSAFTGTGTVNEALPAVKIPGATTPLNRTQIVNHTFIPSFGFVIDPERQTEPSGSSIPFRNATQLSTPPNATAGGNYVNKAAPYTYPDRNNFFLAMMDPATGQIVVPSFHRPDLFTNTNYTNPAEQIAQSLNPNNPKWTATVPEGRLMTVRPRLAEHPNFPQVPPNADGTYTGDVSNLRFITGSQKNDSIWMDFGGPVLEWRGQKYKALVAPLILDLNSRINLSVAGNIRMGDTNSSNVGPSPNPDTYIENHPKHTSNQGWGPWEVNPTAVFPNSTGLMHPTVTGPNWELYALLRQRFPNPTPVPQSVGAAILHGAVPQQDSMYQSDDGRLGHVAQPLVPGSPPTYGPLLGLLSPPYSLVDPDGLSTLRPLNPDPMTIQPGTTPPPQPYLSAFSPFPFFPGRFPNTQAAYTGQNSSLKNHPSLFNPFQWRRGGPTSTVNHPFGNDDLMEWVTRHTDPKARFTNSDLYQGAAAFMSNPTNVGGTARVPANINTPFFHATTTTFSSSQHWAEVPVAIGPGQFVNLGPIDVNRHLADYRKTAVWLNTTVTPNRYEPLPPSPLNQWNPNLPAGSPGNEPAHYAKARLARQNLARDIFVRLVAMAGLVDGTNIVYEQSNGYLRAPGNAIINVSALPATTQADIRQLAQLAANIVDYVDQDDNNTAFVWNPVDPFFAVQYAGGGGNVVDPATGLPYLDPSADPLNFAAATAGERVVYGTELPRLVINEAYSSVDNDRADTSGPATRPLKRRYWVELHNPLPADANPVATGLEPLGSARLQYQTTVTQLQDPTNPAVIGPYTNPSITAYNPYRLEIAVAPAGQTTPYTNFLAANPTTATPALDTALIPAANMELKVQIGGVSPATTLPPTLPKLTYDPTAPSVPVNALMTADDLNIVKPANGSPGVASVPGSSGLNNGYYVMGPLDRFPSGGVENTMSLADAPPGVPTPAAPVNALSFEVTPTPPTTTNITDEVTKTSVILLRRLVNPYLLPQLDPALPNYNPYITVDYLENVPTRDRARFTTTPGSRPPSDAASIGRRHPYMAYPNYLAGTGVDGIQDQAGATTPPSTFFLANNPLDNNRGTAPNNFGLEWLVHLDRKLINNLELLHVSTQSPALLTQRFFSQRTDPTGMTVHGYEYQRHTTWNAVVVNATDPLVPALRQSGFHRMLDLLVTGNSMPGIPIGGREPGKINPNTINNVSLLNALLDPQPGNSFATGGYAQNPNLETVYPGVGGPLPVWTALNTVIPDSDSARTPNGVPRATIAETGTMTGDRPFRSFFGSGDVQDSLLRTNRQVSTPTVPGQPILFNNNGTAHPYIHAEPLRKMMNSLTPTSDSFLVVMTVGFFEVENAGPYSVTNQPVLGKELFDRVPGDLRSQYAALVDRSQLAVEHDVTPGATEGAILANVASDRLPVQIKLLRDANVGANQIVVEASGVDDRGNAAPGSLYDNGIALTLQTGRLLRLGNGDAFTTITSGTNQIVSGDGEWVKIAAIAQLNGPDAAGNPVVPVPGHYVITLEPGFTPANAPGTWVAGRVNRYHAAGTKVSTLVMGNPGPQTGVTLEQLRLRGLVPYLTRLDP